ncbi:efflux RND transporter periplasmic adaptor subunit [Desulfogranum mediterraneum]|uniref:efflux RND transporter periplasmic adaptor subunit n=1 Tax=Desulfogranum mediterraneum TaxID=160661 RepID=UPI0003F93ED6|nr:efflux RND transporter periplasmic adaptor subunit [Desulfogranum mediterraneum]
MKEQRGEEGQERQGSADGQSSKGPAVGLRMLIVGLTLLVGIGAFVGLKKMKKPPRQKPTQEQALAVQVVSAEPADTRVLLQGYGEIISRTTLPLTAEVAGRIIGVHEQLEVGGRVAAGTVLVRIDDRDYQLDLATATARLQPLQRDLDLRQRELARVTALYRDKKVGTLSSLEQAEAAVNTIVNQISQVEQNRDLARLRIQRCIIRAPFGCRLVAVNVEQGEYVTVGRQLVTVVDDGALEVQVALDSREAARWLQLRPKGAELPGNWFSRPEPVPCRLVWTEDAEVAGAGRLDRIVRYAPKTRTLVVAIRLEADIGSAFPLVEGMFCRVELPGARLESVYILPRQAVTHEQTVYTVVANRLQTTPVTVIRTNGTKAYVSAGLAPGDQVITTRLEDPLEQALVKIIAEDAGQ